MRRSKWSSRRVPRPCVLRLGEQEIIGRFDPDGAPRMGETVTLGIDMARACLFDPDTNADSQVAA